MRRKAALPFPGAEIAISLDELRLSLRQVMEMEG